MKNSTDDGSGREAQNNFEVWDSLFPIQFFCAVFIIILSLGLGLMHTQAIIPEEFAPLAFLFRVFQILEIVFSVLISFQFALMIRGWRRGIAPQSSFETLFLGFYLLGLMGSPVTLFWFHHRDMSHYLIPMLAYAWSTLFFGAVFLVRFSKSVRSHSKRRDDYETLCLPLRGWGFRNIFRGLLDLMLIGMLSGFIAETAEAYLYTHRFAGLYFSHDEFHYFLLYAFAHAVLYCWTLGGFSLFFLCLLGFALSWLHKRRFLRAEICVVLICFYISVWAGLLGCQLILTVLKDEISALGFLPLLILSIVLLAPLITLSGLRNLRCMLQVQSFDPLMYFRQLLSLCVCAISSPVKFPFQMWNLLKRKISLRGYSYFTFCGLFFTALFGVVLIMLNYPKLHDYSAIALHVYSSALILMLFAAFAQLAALLRGFPIVKGLWLWLLFAGAFALIFLGRRVEYEQPNVRVIAKEYGVINKVFIEQMSFVTIPFRELPGMKEAKDPNLAFHPQGSERYPDIGDLRDVAAQQPPVIIILYDALRADRLGVYGHDKGTSPNIDEFAREAVVFQRAYSASTATSNALKCLFTGKYSTRYMLETNLPPMFTNDLIGSGYRHFLMTVWPTDYNGISMQMFLRGLPEELKPHAHFHPFSRKEEDDMMREAVDAVKSVALAATGEPEGQRGWMCYFHLTATHFPWGKRSIAKDFGNRPEDIYDNTIHFCDYATGLFFDGLKEAGIYDKATIILMSDHGTGLKDHGRYAGFLNYEEQIRIPLLIKMPGIAPGKVNEVVSLIDLAPTIVGLHNPGAENRFDGLSLLPLLRNKDHGLGRNAIFNLCAFEDSYAVIWEGRWKYVLHRMEDYEQLFDLASDPQERKNILRQEGETREKLQSLMAAFLWRGRGSYNNPYHFKPFVE